MNTSICGVNISKIVRFSVDEQEMWGIWENNIIKGISGDIFSSYSISTKTFLPSEVKLLAPSKPSKAICVGLNYFDHAEEMKLDIPGIPLFFLKPPSSVTSPLSVIDYPDMTNDLHYEAEMAVVIKKTAKDISTDESFDYILGYTCANDITARDLQKNDGQWTRSKSFDTFLPFGPWIETEINPHNLDIKLYLNGEIKQHSNTSNLIFKVPDLISYLSRIMTLNPGDIILTGTPAGVGPMMPGDVVKVEIDGLGTLENYVQKINHKI